MAEQKLVRFKVNNVEHEVYVEPNWTLYYVLKRKLGLTGIKQGCDGIGECGYCTVLMDGRCVYSCLILGVGCEGKNITTIEGLTPPIPGRLDPVQKAFIQHGAFQCGYCTPAMILTAKCLLDKNPDPTEEQIKEAISGVVCRCTGYYKYIEAIKSLRKGQ